MDKITAIELLKTSVIVEDIIKEYLGQRICVMGKRLDFLTLNKKECFQIRFNHGKLLSIFYQDGNDFSSVYTHYNNEKAQILKSK